MHWQNNLDRSKFQPKDSSVPLESLKEIKRFEADS